MSLELVAVEEEVLMVEKENADFFEAALQAHDNPRGVANWVINEVLGELKGRSVTELPFSGEDLGALVGLIDDDTISGKIAKEVFAEMLVSGESPAAIVDAKGLKQVTDTGALQSIIDALIEANPSQVAQYKSGKVNLLGFFVGQVMKQTQGKANPKIVNELLKKHLE